MLAGFLGLPVDIEELVGHWLPLPADQRWWMGESVTTGTLVETTIVGARVWDQQSKFRIRISVPSGCRTMSACCPVGSALRWWLPWSATISAIS